MTSIIPAIDIMEGRCVRLSKGDYNARTTYEGSPADMARLFEDCGVQRIHLVDLEGAKASSPCNLRTLEAIASKSSVELEWGGGIKSAQALQDVFNAGATQAIIGSIAAQQPQLMCEWLGHYGPDKIVLGADLKDGLVAVKGWLEISHLTANELIDKFLPEGISQLIATDISRDGMLEGPSFEIYRTLALSYPSLIITVSGGISSMADIEKVEKAGLPRVIVGKAFYENRITAKDILSWSTRK